MSTDAEDATSADTSMTIFFPPRQHVDFVIHYADRHFHVHKFVLHHHSAYFRTYFLTLPALPRGRSATKKRKKAKRSSAASSNQSSSGSDSDSPQSCRHPDIAHCIHLPQQTRLVEKIAATADDFDVFLRHLHFGLHYCYPLFLPKTDIDLGADFLPVSLHFPAITSLDWTTATTPLRLSADSEFLSRNESLLTLAHYLDCGAMMKQCEEMMLTIVEYGERTKQKTWAAGTGASWLLFAERYRLDRVKKMCLAVVAAADKDILQNEKYKRAKLTWDSTLMAEVLEAALARKG